MSAERLEQLKSILAQDPKNTFARYALGMEYSSAGETDSAMQEFRTLLELDADYANAFFMGAQALQHAERIEEAIQWLRDGSPVRIGLEIATRRAKCNPAGGVGVLVFLCAIHPAQHLQHSPVEDARQQAIQHDQQDCRSTAPPPGGDWRDSNSRPRRRPARRVTPCLRLPATRRLSAPRTAWALKSVCTYPGQTVLT